MESYKINPINNTNVIPNRSFDMSSTTKSDVLASEQLMGPTSFSTWIATKKYWYVLSFIIPLLPILSAYMAVQSGSGAWLWATVAFFYGGITLADKYFGNDDANPSDDLVEEIKHESYYKQILYLAIPMIWASVVTMAYVVSQYDWSWLSILGGSLSAGLMGAVGVNLGHELGHKVTDKGQQAAAKLSLAVSGYGHFVIEHNKGHHKDVATPEDPASSRMGESIYKFVKREIPGAFRRAWGLEATRLKRLGKSEWSLNNEIIQPAIITVTAYTLMLAYFGPVMIPFLAIVAAFGYWNLTCANYIEHYGLLRLKEKSGRYERCKPHHSWNSNHKVSNLVLVHLQRHSDHHAHPTRAYQVLRDYDNVPKLQAGYPWMFVLAMIPPLWFAIMNPRVAEWANGDMTKVNVDPDSKETMFTRFHKVEQKAAA